MGYLHKFPTYEFASKIVCFNWREVLTAIERQFVSRQFAIDFAMAKLAVLDEYPDALVDLASLNKNDDIHPFIDNLAVLDEAPNDAEEKLLYFVLAWLYETKDSYDDPLSIVEEVYADFDYPEHISGFIKYMPSDEPDLGSVEKNCARLVEMWNHFLEEQSVIYNP